MIKNTDLQKNKTFCPLIPMGAITGRPTRDDLREFLGEYLRVGIDQFLIYPRSGLEVEYLSEGWFEICRHIIEFAAENGMAIWLYDEYNWPSGKAGGKVIREDPDFAFKKLSLFYNGYGNNSPGLNKGYFWGSSTIPLYADLLNPKAVDSFIKLTHEKYAERFSEYFGTTIKGFFSDEPNLMPALRFHVTAGTLVELPYYPDLEQDYLKAVNRDFRKDVELYFDGNAPSDLWETYFHITGKRFQKTFFDKIRSWCDLHQLLFTGHLLYEDSTLKSIWAEGDPMGCMSSFSMAGMDEIFTHTTPDTIEWVTMKMFENAFEKKHTGGIAELFALGPSDMTLAKMRQMIWLVALHGVDHYLTAVSAIDSRGNTDKPMWYNPNTPTQPWFDAYRELGDDARIAAEFAAKKSSSYKIAVRYPQALTINSEIFKTASPSSCSIVELLRELVVKQWPTRLIEETNNEIYDYQVVLHLEPDCIKEENSGTIFKDIDECLDWIEANVARDAEIINSDGILQENLLVKSFSDSSVVVLSLSEEGHEKLTLRRNGKENVTFDLPGQGVWISTRDAAVLSSDERTFTIPDEEVQCEILSANTMRIMFDDKKICKFSLAEDMENLHIIMRNYGGQAAITLNGKEVVANKPCESLPFGLRNLYRTSEPFSLLKGGHELKLVSDVKDYPYLPLAFLSGNFGLQADHELIPLESQINPIRFRQQGLPEYIGKIVFTRKVSLKDFSAVELVGNDFAVELLINGESLGRQAWAPFKWIIPDAYRLDNVELTLVVATSVGPLFGNYSDPNNENGIWLRSWPANFF